MRMIRSIHAYCSDISQTGVGEPDCMNAARNSPSVFPPFANIWSDTEIEPAL